MIGYHLIVELGIAMTIEKLNRLAELGNLMLSKTTGVEESTEYALLLNEWKKEQDSKFDARKLKIGDTVIQVESGHRYVIIALYNHVIGIRTEFISNSGEWIKADA